jgi:hypothetical protein
MLTSELQEVDIRASLDQKKGKVSWLWTRGVTESIERWQRGSIWTAVCPPFMQIEKLGFPLSTPFQGERMGILCGSSRWRCGRGMMVQRGAGVVCKFITERE